MKPLEPAEPRWAGRYRLLASLGEGGMGRVLLALSPDGRLAALKQIHPGLAHDHGFRQRFHHEVDASRKVSGAYAAAVLDADPDAEVPWLASVYVPGPSLREAIDTAGPLPAESVRYLAVGLGTALADIHRAGLIHRDLKPTNVLLAADGPRVIDFGIARAAEGSDLTGTGAVVGSPAFMSPEQAESGHLTPASDVFSLGAVLVLAATGRGPFTGATTAETLYNIVHTRPDLSAVPSGIRELAEHCLAKDPALRPTPRQLLDALGPVSPGVSWPVAVRDLIARQDAEVREVLSWPAPEPPPAPARAKRRTGKVVAAATGVACLAAAAAVAVRVGGPQEVVRAEPQLRPATTAEALSLTRLRRTDPCRVLADGQVPSAGTLTAADSSLYLNRCDYETGDGNQLTLIVGEPVSTTGARSSGDEIAGRPVLLTGNTGGCEATIQLPTAPELGISVTDSDPSGEACERTRAALAESVEGLRTADALRELPDSSAIPVDPCSLVDDEAARDALGQASGSALTRLHECEWTARGTVSVTVEQGLPGGLPEEGYEPAEIGGVPVYLRRVGDDTCAITWKHRDVDEERTENVRIFATGIDDPCRAAKRFTEAALNHLGS